MIPIVITYVMKWPLPASNMRVFRSFSFSEKGVEAQNSFKYGFYVCSWWLIFSAVSPGPTRKKKKRKRAQFPSNNQPGSPTHSVQSVKKQVSTPALVPEKRESVVKPELGATPRVSEVSRVILTPIPLENKIEIKKRKSYESLPDIKLENVEVKQEPVEVKKEEQSAPF